MDQIRTAFSMMVNGEQYIGFRPQQQQEEDGGRPVEVGLSDGTLDDSEMEVQSENFGPPPRRWSWQMRCLAVGGLVLILMIGFLVGYASHGKAKPEPVVGATEEQVAKVPTTATPTPTPTPHDDEMNWKDVFGLLSEKVTAQASDRALRDFNLPRRAAGSPEDVHLGNRIFDKFKKLQMNPWTDIHYIQVQVPDSEHPNRILFGSEVLQPEGYLAYSATGTAEGKLVYGNYGRPTDLSILERNNVELKGSVMLLRAGRITFAEQVANAAAKGACAVLIYPDPQDYDFKDQTALYGHVHLGSGDPYTPGFPSFNHTQFPPTRSSGLPSIPAQTITAQMAKTILANIGGPEEKGSSDFKGGITTVAYTLGGVENITVEVKNRLVNKEIHNVFGVIKGVAEPDRYVVLGAQRDAWGSGYARAAVGTAMLTQLAEAIVEMVEKDGFVPKRSIVFASWSAGEFGSVGATEWLEGYLMSLNKHALTYISLDGAITGRGSFKASASPLLYSLLEGAMKEVKSPLGSGFIYDMVGRGKWETNALKPMTMDDTAYPFLAAFGIPSISFHFISPNTEVYPYYGTNLDTTDHLDYETNHRTAEQVAVAAQLAGHMTLRLVHTHLLPLDVRRYGNILTQAVAKVYLHIKTLEKAGQLKDISANWLTSARGSFQRAASAIRNVMDNMDVDDVEACRILNERIMAVEQGLLSPYVSPVDTPFRHLLLGRGPHTFASIAETADTAELRVQLALSSWSLQGCANAMMGNIWDLDDQI